ncbi:Pnap_2097 family protein [Amaricoccus macauensis]|uniref:Pnap_2097 family protein n=1 Tax=Amaricoccus macauensis TaxID=57001 RepID=UPI003C79B79E
MVLHAYPTEQRAHVLRDRVRLSMGQLAPIGFSEQWLLKDAGDRHWALIAGALGQERSVFRDGTGRPVYAAFCATWLELSRPGLTLLGEDAEILSTLSSPGGSCLASVHVVSVRGEVRARLTMISTFVSHDDSGSNRRVCRNGLMDERLPALPVSGPDVMALHQRARSVLRTQRGRQIAGPVALRVTPVPGLDFNAVGLLYFPTFSRLAETASWQADPQIGPLAAREVVYLGNIDQGEEIAVFVDGAEQYLVRGDGRVLGYCRTNRDPRTTQG